ncbi:MULTISPECIES: c-type cytochrome [unclassified Chelatococcus]|uniref:c-type cytochrome n=1 Tax=unclassified Chelatococcus TaxID=2638111 RepID=UPI001BCCA4B9|nr:MULTISPECIES: c-type cytochrome [unclassified Chelatococcus]MBS7700021.1 c-type cytochrome [Chelatococcus sp. YT9]MBX3556714.1 c-type cytochrome [Chelatococcus sp.]
MIRRAALVLACASILLAGCQREERETRPDPALGSGDEPTPVTVLAPGGERPATSHPKAAFEANAFHLSEGKRLFDWFNCSGCHANGGGGMGPALMDDKWIYGSSIENIHATIRDGRPNGMPSFRDRVPDDQIWELAAFVRSLSGLASKAAAPGRNDAMMPHPSENRLPDAASLGRSP